MQANKEKLLSALERFSEMLVVVVGDVMLDVYEFCLASESKPIDYEKQGKRAYKAQRAIRALGGAANVAANLAALGAKTSLVGVTGNDESYFSVRELADTHGISHFLIRDNSRPTTKKIRLYLDDEYLLRRDDEVSVAIDEETSATLVNEVVREIHQADVLVLSDYSKGVFSEGNARQLIKECRLKGIPSVVDFKPANAALFEGAGIIAPNADEARALLPSFNISTAEAGCVELHEMLKCDNTVITLGAHGLCGYDGSSFFHIPANKVRPADSVGCGDTVRAGLALGVGSGLSLREAAELANDAAGVIVQKPATAFMTIDELRAAMGLQP